MTLAGGDESTPLPPVMLLLLFVGHDGYDNSTAAHSFGELGKCLAWKGKIFHRKVTDMIKQKEAT